MQRKLILVIKAHMQYNANVTWRYIPNPKHYMQKRKMMAAPLTYDGDATHESFWEGGLSFQVRARRGQSVITSSDKEGHFSVQDPVSQLMRPNARSRTQFTIIESASSKFISSKTSSDGYWKVTELVPLSLSISSEFWATRAGGKGNK